MARRVAPRIHAVPAPKSSLVRFVDALDAPVVLIDRAGHIAVLNAAAKEFFVGAAGSRLRDSVETEVRRALGARPRHGGLLPNAVRQIDCNHHRFAITIVAAGTDLAANDIGAMVMLRREAITPALHESEDAVSRRFHLTPQEARVALLLSDHRSNREIAGQLGISEHTARHHTERVLTKLEIHSRYDVKKVLAYR